MFYSHMVSPLFFPAVCSLLGIITRVFYLQVFIRYSTVKRLLQQYYSTRTVQQLYGILICPTIFQFSLLCFEAAYPMQHP